MTTQHMTVCVADIARFSVATRNMPLNDMAEFLQGYYERVGDILLSHRGKLAKYIGDSVLSVFDHGREEIAVRAMVALRESYAEYVAALGGDAAASELCVGIATGDVVEGQMGHPQILAYNVVGRPVLIAFTLAKLGGIVVDAPTYDAVSGCVAAETADSRSFRVIALR